MRYKLSILLLLVLAYITSAFGVEGRPKMRRACLNRLDSTLDLLWFRPTDNCGTFTNFNIYGRDDQLNLFQVLFSSNNYSINNISFKLKNLKNWEFFIVYNKACNGTDSSSSDTIVIDNLPPIDSQLDSVSVDIATQKTIIGWSNNSSPDVKGYLVYHVTGTNSVIQTTSSTFYLDLGPRDPAIGAINYSVAAFDSCNNTSLISTPHTTIFLQSTYDQCNKTIDLRWSPYIGWAAGSYEIFLKINAGNFQKIGSVISNINQFTYNFSVFGDVYCFYVRALKQASSISSSSNITCVNSSSILSSSESYIAKASVQNQLVELTLVAKTGTSLQKINVYRGENGGGFTLWRVVNTIGGITELTDNQVNVHTKSYKYYFTTEGPCNLIFDTSQIAKTILLNVSMLSPGDQVCNWTIYNDFIKLTQKQEFLLSNNDNFNRGSPWNIISTLSNSDNTENDNTNFSLTQEKICYCIRAIENNSSPKYNRKDTSYSNIECVTADPIIYFPNAIQLNGFNTIFYPKGVFIDSTKSSFQIYNRWGEIVYETNNINRGWDGKENGILVQSDVYVYRAIIVGLNKKVLYFNGTLTVLK